MYKLLVFGAGNMGSAAAAMLASSNDYQVHLADLSFENAQAQALIHNAPNIKTVAIDASDKESVNDYLKRHQICFILSCLPARFNPELAHIALENRIAYVDPSLDEHAYHSIKAIASNAETILAPRLGLIPGFINLIAHQLIQEFDSCQQVKIQLGLLSQTAEGQPGLHPGLSIQSLIHLYTGRGRMLAEGMLQEVKPLSNAAPINFNGMNLESFPIAVPIDRLHDKNLGRIENLEFNMLRQHEHARKMRVLFEDLKIHEQAAALQGILQPQFRQDEEDLVLVDIQISGIKNGEYHEKSYQKHIKPEVISGVRWQALQIAGASAISAIIAHLVQESASYRGAVYCEDLPLAALTSNHFGKRFKGMNESTAAQAFI